MTRTYRTLRVARSDAGSVDVATGWSCPDCHPILINQTVPAGAPGERIPDHGWHRG